MPASRARATAAARSETPSLTKMAETLFLMVFSVRPRRAAIAPLAAPAAISSRISRSRAVSWPNGRAAPAWPASAKYPAIRSATSRPKMAWPLATATTARRISAGCAPLST
jgi:hypothetical protein